MQKHKYNMGFCDYKTLYQFNTKIPDVGLAQLTLYICKDMGGWHWLTGAQAYHLQSWPTCWLTPTRCWPPGLCSVSRWPGREKRRLIHIAHILSLVDIFFAFLNVSDHLEAKKKRWIWTINTVSIRLIPIILVVIGPYHNRQHNPSFINSRDRAS